MSLPDAKKLLKIRLHTDGEDVETPFGEDLGPTNVPGARCVRLANIPFLYAKPTYGDVIVVEPGRDGVLTWNSNMKPPPNGKRAFPIAEDGGRFLMIIDYRVTSPERDGRTAFRVLAMTCESVDIVVEGCFGPKGELPGRAYLAVPSTLSPLEVASILEDPLLPFRVPVIHPAGDDDDDDDVPTEDHLAIAGASDAVDDGATTRGPHGMNA